MSLLYAGVVPSPTTSGPESETIPLRVITRTQAKRNAQIEITEGEKSPRDNKAKENVPSSSKQKRKRPRSRRSRKSKEKKSSEGGDSIPKELEGVLKPQEKSNAAVQNKENPGQQQKQKSSSGTDSGGSVLVEKVNEPLEAAPKAYNNRITAFTELPKKLQEYPNPRAEKIGLAAHQQLIRETQNMLEGPPPVYTRQPASVRPKLDTIVEATSSVEKGSEAVSLPPFKDAPLEKMPMPSENPWGYTTADFGDEIPEFEEAFANEMWEAVHDQVAEKDSSDISPPFSIVDFTNREAANEDDQHLQEEVQTVISMCVS